MFRDRLIQLVALIVVLISIGISAIILPVVMQESDDYALRYTDVSVEGAPPFVALGTAIAAVRGLIVDYLWVKINIQQEKGLFYEVMADAELITKLQPRFAAVWAFHGHNMAYNVSVATHTLQERWEWVNAGIRLVRNDGIRNNPNDLLLHKELAFWFAHKIDGYADDAHLYYKKQFCQEWHFLLGMPPEDYDERVVWIKAIADAPGTLHSLEKQTPGVMELISRLKEHFPPNSPAEFKLDQDFLSQYTMWQQVTGQSAAAEILGIDKQFRRESPYFTALDQLASDPELQEMWTALINHIRKRVLIENYNMDPGLMYEYTRDLGPLDWRHPQAHAVYWARRGSQFGESRVPEDEIYTVLNNDRIQVQGLQALSRSGRITYDFFSNANPARFPDPRWIDRIDQEFERLYVKHINVRGAGGETFITFLQNFMGSAIREWYRAGEREKAQQLLDRLEELFRKGVNYDNPEWSVPLEVFVRKETFDNYDAQPHLALSDVAASLRYGYLVGICRDRPEVLRDAINFANEVTDFFKGNRYYNFVNKFGVGRMKDLLGQLNDTAIIVFAQLMIDRSLPMPERMTLWSQVDKYLPGIRVRAYDIIAPTLAQELSTSPWGKRYTLAEVLPEPPGLDEYRRQLAILRQQEIPPEQATDTIAPK